MLLTEIVVISILVMGIISIFKPVLLVYSFAILPVLPIAISVSEYDTELKVMRVGSINIFAMDFLILLLLAILILFLIRASVSKIQRFSCLTGPISKFIFIIFTWDIIIGILSYQNGFHLENILRHLSAEAVMFIAILIPQITDIDIKKERFFIFLSYLCVFLVLIGLWRYFTHNVSLTSSGTLRAISGNSIIIFLVPICYFLFYKKYSTNHNNLFYIAILLMIIGIIIAGHRSGLLTLLFVLFIWFMSLEHHKIDFMFIPLWTGALIVCIVIILPTFKISAGESFSGDIILRFQDTFNLENKTSKHRLDMWKYSLDFFKRKPVIGAGSFPAYLKGNTDKDSNTVPKIQTALDIPPHNLFINKILHEGLIGLTIITFFFYQLIARSKSLSIVNKNHANFFLIYILSFLIFSFFNTTFENITGRIYFFLIVGFLNSEILNLNYTISKTRILKYV
jgi:O-antigen ligase